MTDELLDIVNEKDQIIGKRMKSDVHRHDGPIHREVGIILMDNKKNVLLQKRSMSMKNYPGLWVISAGGHLKLKEEPFDAAKREFSEELGFETDLAFLCKSLDHEKVENHMVYWYYAKYNDERICFSKDEVESVNFFSQKELTKLMSIDEIENELDKHKGSRNNFSLKMYKICKRVWEKEFDNTIKDQFLPKDSVVEEVYYVDENDTVLAKIDKEIANFNPKYIHREVGIAIVDEERRMLWQQRSKIKRVNPLRWTISTAGHVTFGTSYIQAAHRELLEETGFDTDLHEIYTEFHTSKNENHIMKFYIGKYSGQKIIPQKSEVAQYKFLNIDMISKMEENGEEIGEGSFNCAERIAKGEFDKYLF